MRYILTFLMTSALAFGLGCQTASSSSTEIKNDNPVDISKSEKPAEKTAKDDIKDESVDEHNEGEAERISLEDAKKAFDAGETIFIDTRSSTAFQNEHIKGAINVPMGEFEQTYKNVPKDKKIIAYCS